MKPAKHVGGDFYDYFMISKSRLAFAIGDVSGKGVPAALFMSVSRTVLRTLAFEGGMAGQVLTKVNEILARDNAECMFVTLFYAVLDLDTGAIEFSSAGHDDVHLLKRSAASEPLEHVGPAIGLMGGVEYPTMTRKVAPGDIMLLLTDGITEAFNADGLVFGLDRLTALLNKVGPLSTRDIVETVAQEVTRFTQGREQSDDITCLAVQFRGRPQNR